MSAIMGARSAETAAAKGKRTGGRLARAITKLGSVLTPGESVEDVVFQLRLWALVHRRAMVATTDRRIIFFWRGLLGGFQMVDYQWQDVKNAHVREHFFPTYLGADIAIASKDGRRVKLRGLGSEIARRIYSYVQAQEQAWREKSRIREMEELRAKSGGITLNGPGNALASPGGQRAGADDVTKKLKEAKELLDDGAISDAEYETIKARVLNVM